MSYVLLKKYFIKTVGFVWIPFIRRLQRYLEGSLMLKQLPGW